MFRILIDPRKICGCVLRGFSRSPGVGDGAVGEAEARVALAQVAV